ncbi:MAG: LamG-like jellyroll fold domain-containing protein [Armatimonadota bacterium]
MAKLLLCAALILVGSVCLAQTAPDLAQPWQTDYAGADATAPWVLGYWQFNQGAGLKDSSGKGNDLQFVNVQVVPNGKFGGALESSRGWPVEDKKHGAEMRGKGNLSPKGPFTIEMWISPKAELKDYGQAILLDKKYASQTDYQLVMTPPTTSGLRQLSVNLGFGSESANWASEAGLFEAGKWYHIAFVYDGAGRGQFYLNGRSFGSVLREGRGKITPGTVGLTIGDRVGSYHYGFPGYIDNVRISDRALQFAPASFALNARRLVYVRMEKTPTLQFVLTNLQRTPLTGAKAEITLQTAGTKQFAIPELAAGASYHVDYPLDTTVKPGRYEVVAAVTLPLDPPLTTTQNFSVTIVPRSITRMPVVMWGANPTEYKRLLEIGFTHCAGLSVDFASIWKAGQPVAGDSVAMAEKYKQLDTALENGLSVFAGLSPGSWARSLPEHNRVDSAGKKLHDVCASHPKIKEFCYNVGASAAQTFGDFPAFDAAMAHTEVRSDSRPCYHDYDKAAYKAATGLDIPAGLTTYNGVPYQNLKDFPTDRIIPDNYPLLTYYKWYWKAGDGWNGLHSELVRGLKSTGKDIWTWHDPAVRAASMWGSGGDVDFLSQWTYSYPDPVRIGLATDELFAMASGHPGQQVMNMTQMIWYRSQTAPQPGEAAQKVTATFIDKDTGPAKLGAQAKAGEYQAQWEKEQPNARFITPSPMHIREAFWTKISRPIQGIMYHGWGSLVPAEGGSYQYTNPATKFELARLIDTVVEPLGPTLMAVPDRKADVAFLESFTSQMLAKRGTYGWNGGWQGDAYLILNYAQLQPEIIYDETVMQKGLDQYKVLVLADCDVLTRSIADKIIAFQKQGGIVIGDQNLAPAIHPDIMLKFEDRPKDADKGREWLQAKAAGLRKELDPHYSRYYSSSNPDIVTHARQYGSTDYLFTVNDKREFGDYVGHHKLVMENGLPSQGVLTVKRNGGRVYDLVNSREVPTLPTKGGSLQIATKLGPCDGQMLMVTARPLAKVSVEAATAAKLGAALPVKVAIADDKGQPLAAIVPVRVDLIAPDGQHAEFSGYYAVRDGKLALKFDLASNDQPGLWQIAVRELASGKTDSAYVRVTGS